MATFADAVKDNRENKKFTENMGVTLDTSSRANVDLFFVIGALRGQGTSRLYDLFEKAYQENPEVATRIMLWARDVRGGAGERQIFRDLLKYLEKNHPLYLERIINFTPEFGRWDDLLVFEKRTNKDKAFSLINTALTSNHGLAAKWMPRKGPVARELRDFLGLSPKAYRKLLVRSTDVVETKMCAKNWNDIEFGKLPSLASARYNKAFVRNCGERYNAYVERLKQGEDKVNTGAVFPYDILKPVVQDIFGHNGYRLTGDEANHDFVIEQWNNQKNFLTGEANMLPMVDVSESMYSTCGGNLTCMEVAVSIGLYISDFQTGPFKNLLLSFTDLPKFMNLGGDIVNKVKHLHKNGVGYNTDFTRAYEKILSTAKKGKVSQEDMPDYLLVMSDMEFDIINRSASWKVKSMGRTSFKDMRKKFKKEGYELPTIVFWNIQSRQDNVPVKFNEDGVCLVSGFSPAIVKSILSCSDMNPEKLMMNTVMNERYNIWA